MAVAWTALGLLAATLFGMLFYLGSRIDSMSDAVASRLDNMAARIDALGARFDSRLDSLSSELRTHLEGHPR